MKLKFTITFLSGLTVVKKVEGIREVDGEDLTLRELSRVPEIEAFLEKLTGLRVHIDSFTI